MANGHLSNALNRLHREIGLSYELGRDFEAEKRHPAGAVLASRLSREPAARKKVDAACRYWIKNGTWPAMDDPVEAWTSDRLAEAYLTATLFHHHGFSAESKTENEILDFLLVECWEAMGLRRMQARLLSQMLESVPRRSEMESAV